MGDLKQALSQYGAILEVVLKRDVTGTSRGFAFVTFAEAASVVKLLANYANNTVQGQWVDVKPAWGDREFSVGVGADDPNEERKMFIGGLAWHITEEDISQYFSQFGTIVEVLLKKDAAGASRGFGFVTFENVTSMQ